MDEPEVIKVPKPEATEYGKLQFAAEFAFSVLVNTASKSGIELKPVMGLMYLPSQEVTQQFIEACRALIDSLKVSA